MESSSREWNFVHSLFQKFDLGVERGEQAEYRVDEFQRFQILERFMGEIEM